MTQLLEYDDLPAGSGLRRVYRGEGVSITVGGAEPSERARRHAARRAARRAAIDCAAILVILGGLGALLLPSDVPLRFRLEHLPAIAYPVVAIFCGSLFLMIWQQRYVQLYGHLCFAMRQVTIVEADPQSVQLRGDGPFGVVALDFPATELRRIHCAPRDDATGRQVQSLRWLSIERVNGQTTHALCGEELDLQWVALTLTRTLRLPVPVEKLPHELTSTPKPGRSASVSECAAPDSSE